MKNDKVLLLLPDGIGLRNFAYSNFYELGIAQGFEPIFWNNTPFDLTSLGFNEIKIENAKTHPLTDIYKNARKHIELNHSIKRSGDPVYNSYRFPYSYKNIKTGLKSFTTQLIVAMHSSEKGLQNVRERIKRQERKTVFYHHSLETLQKEKPAFVFCTNQRPMLAIAPLLAAQDLGIPTATFIFSWDNLPKATMVVETDYYFVWSDHMKKELLYYCNYINEKQVFVTGTPQFEIHSDKSKLLSQQDFYTHYNLDLKKKYICYSGDDITTSPDDPQYLSDTALAIRQLNTTGHQFGILFRRCPVDFSTRFDAVLNEYKDVIISLPPLWKKTGDAWNTVLPTKEDIALQQNTIYHTEMVINLGSSMIFDYACYNKPCAFINYDAAVKVNSSWSVKKIYNYIHFRSMPNKEGVIWLNNATEIADKIEAVLQVKETTILSARQWSEIINKQPHSEASQRIWNAIKTILS